MMPVGVSPFWQSAFPTLTLLMALVVASAWYGAVRIASGKPVIESRGRRRVPWGAESSVLAAIMLLGSLASLLPRSETYESPKIDLTSAAGLGLTWFLMAGFVILWIRVTYSTKWSDFGLPRSAAEAGRDVVLGVGACLAMLVPVYVVQLLLVMVIGLPSSHPTIEQLLTNPTLETIVAAALMAVVIAPLFEELAFRVLLQGWLERIGGRRAWWPVFVSAALFALAHSGQGWAPVPLAVLAAGIGYVYRQTHRLVPIVAMHMAFNALGLAMAIATGGQADVVPPPAP